MGLTLTLILFIYSLLLSLAITVGLPTILYNVGADTDGFVFVVVSCHT